MKLAPSLHPAAAHLRAAALKPRLNHQESGAFCYERELRREKAIPLKER